MIRPTARPRVIAAFAAVVLMAACAGPQVDARQSTERTYSTMDVAEPMSIGDIVLQLESNRSEADIVAELFDRGLAAPAGPADLTLLRRAGASPELLQAIYDAPLAGTDSAGNVVIIRESAYVPYVPYVVDPWPYHYPNYRYRPPPHRPPPHRTQPHPGHHPGSGRIDRPQRPPITRPTPQPRPPTPNRYSPRQQPTPGMTPPTVNRPAAKPVAPAGRPSGGAAPAKPSR